MDELEALAPEFAKLTKDFLFGDIWERPGLLQRAFPGSDYEAVLVQKLHENGRTIHEWVCVHVHKVIAYIRGRFPG